MVGQVKSLLREEGGLLVMYLYRWYTHTPLPCAFLVQEDDGWDLAECPHSATSPNCVFKPWVGGKFHRGRCAGPLGSWGWYCSDHIVGWILGIAGEEWEDELFFLYHLPLGLRKECWGASLVARVKLNILIGIEEVYLRYWPESILLSFSKINIIHISYNLIFTSLSQISVTDKNNNHYCLCQTFNYLWSIPSAIDFSTLF